MARILVQLKLRLLLGALRATNAAKASFIVSSTVALLVAVGTFVGLAALRHNGGAADLTTVIYTVFALGWLILPLVTFGLDATLDPATLALHVLALDRDREQVHHRIGHHARRFPASIDNRAV